ncbi:MAG: hypothetical protein WC878_07295 [Candidatus Paceibacterota bacterium]|jgi:hypothetical protein
MKDPIEKSIIDAYDSYLLAEKAKENRTAGNAEEEDILNILRILTKHHSRKEGFSISEITYVGDCLFWNRPRYLEISMMLENARRDGKVACVGEGHWKLIA